MRAVIQRVRSSNVVIDGMIERSINQGLLILLGIEDTDNEEDIEWLVPKILQMRIFSDEMGKMNLSVEDVQGSLMVISQFTLYASTRKGNRPSYLRSAKPDVAIPLYKSFLKVMRKNTQLVIQEGEFGADMQVTLTNDGPVTILIDTKNRE